MKLGHITIIYLALGLTEPPDCYAGQYYHDGNTDSIAPNKIKQLHLRRLTLSSAGLDTWHDPRCLLGKK